MSVPAHTLLDPHPAGDRYESYTAESARYREVLAEQATQPQHLTVPSLAGYDPRLAALFYDLAKASVKYDSDDRDGRSVEFGQGRFHTAREGLNSTAAVSEVWLLNPGSLFTPLLFSSDVHDGAVDYAVLRNVYDNALYLTSHFRTHLASTELNYSIRVVYAGGVQQNISGSLTAFPVFDQALAYTTSQCSRPSPPRRLRPSTSSSGRKRILFP